MELETVFFQYKLSHCRLSLFALRQRQGVLDVIDNILNIHILGTFTALLLDGLIAVLFFAALLTHTSCTLCCTLEALYPF